MVSSAITLIDKLSTLSKQSDFSGDENAQAQALVLSKQLSASLQKPADAAIELCFSPMFTAAARVAIDLKLFHLIVASEVPVSTAELAAQSGGEETLIARLLRPLAGLGFINEVDENTWASNPITEAMCAPPIQATHIHFWDQGTTSAVKMHSFFREIGYRQPEDARKGIFQYAFNTDKEAFELWHTMPDVMDNFNTAMSGIRGSRPSWVEWWPVEERIFGDGAIVDDDAVLLVDVAGGRGHDIQAFKKAFPNKKGRLVLEDLPAVIDDISELDEGIERVKYDFFTPQPIKGARVYFFHFIFHDWSDDVSLKILSNITAAMKKGSSKLLLNEFILPNKGCPLFPAGFDLQMMTMHAAQERTENQWTSLLQKAGLKVVQFWIPKSGGEGIIEAELA